MASGRMLQKKISNSRKMADLSNDGVRLLYTWLLAHLNANGCFYADPIMINNLVFTRLKKQPKEIQHYLDELAEKRCIVRYQADDGEMYLYYPDFAENQTGLRPEREGDSGIPQPLPEQCRSNDGVNPQTDGGDCGITPAQRNLSEFKGSEYNKQSLPDCPHVEIVDLYHRILPSHPRVLDWTPGRKALLRGRWKDAKERQCLPWWEEYFHRVSRSDFLTGKVAGKEGRPFKPDLEWLVRPNNLTKVIEGRYDNRSVSSTLGETPLSSDDHRIKALTD